MVGEEVDDLLLLICLLQFLVEDDARRHSIILIEVLLLEQLPQLLIVHIDTLKFYLSRPAHFLSIIIII